MGRVTETAICPECKAGTVIYGRDDYLKKAYVSSRCATPISTIMSDTKITDIVDKSFDYLIAGGGVRRLFSSSRLLTPIKHIRLQG